MAAMAAMARQKARAHAAARTIFHDGISCSSVVRSFGRRRDSALMVLRPKGVKVGTDSDAQGFVRAGAGNECKQRWQHEASFLSVVMLCQF
jgi:hypothetical protein